MKFGHMEVLDDPRAEVDAVLLPEDAELQSRLPESDLIYAALAALKVTDSLEDFYLAYIKDSKGKLHKIRDCAERVRATLDEEQGKYVEMTRKVVDAFQSGQIPLKTDGDRYSAILSLIEGDVRHMRQRGASRAGLRDRLLNSTYIYWSYIFHRALYYYRRKRKMDENDYEDACVCLHLELKTPLCLVTKDMGMFKAVSESVQLLERRGIENTLRVLTLEDFRRAF